MSGIDIQVEGPIIILKKEFNAPRKLVWKAWTSPEHVEKWWGPQGFTIYTIEMNVAVDGVWRFVMKGPDGKDYPNKIIYHEIVEFERLFYTSSDDVENDPGQFQTLITFEEIGSKTDLTMVMTFASDKIRDKVVKEYGAIEGATQTLGRLEEVLLNFESPITNSGGN